MIYSVTLNPALDRQLTVPHLAQDTVLRASSRQDDIGGKGFNVSRMLRSLGCESIALGFAGGVTGRILADGLQALAIETSFVTIPGETRTNITVIDEAYEHYIKVNEAGPAVPATAQAELKERVQALAAPGDWWVLSGSLPPGVSPDFYAELIRSLQDQGAFTILDSSGAALRAGLAAGPTLAKPNEYELAELTGLPISDETSLLTAAQTLRDSGVEKLVISLGKSGALLVAGAIGQRFYAPAIEAKNPIGAGDSMVAGIVYCLAQGQSLAEAVSWGLACGAATAACPGTAVGDRASVMRLREKVRQEEFTF